MNQGTLAVSIQIILSEDGGLLENCLKWRHGVSYVSVAWILSIAFNHSMVLYGIKGRSATIRWPIRANKVEGSLTWRGLLRKKSHRVA